MQIRIRLLCWIIVNTRLHLKYPNPQFFRSVLSRIQTEYGDLQSKSPYSFWMREKCGPDETSDSDKYNFTHFTPMFYFILPENVRKPELPPAALLKVVLLQEWCSSFLICKNDTKSRKASHLVRRCVCSAWAVRVQIYCLSVRINNI